MFKKAPQEKQPIPFTQRLITVGIIFFFLYFYFTEFQVKQLEKQQLEKKATAENIIITNLIMNDSFALSPKNPTKTTITINKRILEKAMAKSKGDNIDILTIEVPQAAAPKAEPAPANLTK